MWRFPYAGRVGCKVTSNPRLQLKRRQLPKVKADCEQCIAEKAAYVAGISNELQWVSGQLEALRVATGVPLTD